MESEKYVDLLLTNSKEEDLIYENINKETERFEKTDSYVEHRKILKEYYKELREATNKRLNEARTVRENFRSKRKPITPKKIEKQPDSEELKKCIELFKGLSRSEKYRFSLIVYEREDEKLKNTVSTEKDISDLHYTLVQTVIDFVNDRNLTDIEEVGFSVDSVQSSAKNGMWVPATDSSITVYGYENDEKGLGERRLIDHQM